MTRLQEFRTLLHHVLVHPNNRKRRMAAAIRLIKWQLWKHLFKRPVIVPVGSNRRFKVVCDSKFSSLVLYNRLPDWDEMNFLLRFLRPEDSFIDIGANVGFYTILASTVIFDQPIVAIEANPRNVVILRDQIALNRLPNVWVFDTALGNREGELTFEDCSRETGSLAPTGALSGSHIRVPCTLLDNVLATVKLAAPVVVPKMDVEGCEGMILEGTKATLEAGTVQIWLFELGNEGLLLHGSSAEQLLAVFKQYGYSILYWDEDRKRLGHKGDQQDLGRANYIAGNYASVRERLLPGQPIREDPLN